MALVAFLLDTNAISELFRRGPNADFLAWVGRLPREVQFTSVVVVAEFGRVNATLARRGTPMGDTDTFIAATALRYDLTMVTANLNHTGQVGGLMLQPCTPAAR